MVVGKKNTQVLVMVGLGIISVFAAAFLTSLALGLPNEPDAAAQGEGDNGSELYDFGDAPASYGTSLAADGARHGEPIDDAGPSLTLGTVIDYEADAQTSVDASGDDVTGADDEDGVTIPDLVVGETAVINVEASGAGSLNAWIDWNGNGTFDGGEQIAADQAVAAGNNQVMVTPPTGAVSSTFARFRLSSQGGLAPTGAAFDGEVEDYPVTVRSIVCVNKNLESGAENAGYTVDQFTFSLVSQMQPVDPDGADDGCQQTFIITAGAPFKIIEEIPVAAQPHVGEITQECYADHGEPNGQDGLQPLVAIDEGPPPLLRNDDGSFSSPQVGTAIECFVTNDSVLVCVTKSYGPGADDSGLDRSVQFEVTADGVLVADGVSPAAQEPGDSCFNESGDLQFGVYVAPGSEIAVTELLPDGSPWGIAPLAADACTFDGQTPASPATLSGSTVTVQLPDPATATVSGVDCELTNDTIPVCVGKRFVGGALVLTEAGEASFQDFQFSLNAAAGDELGPRCGQFASVQYYVAPGQSFTISELVVVEDSPIRVVDIECFQGSDGEGNEVGTEHPTEASITVTTSVETTSPINCVFTNDALIVCVTKTLGFNAAAFKMPSNFAFDLAPVDGPEQQLVPTPEDPLCDGGGNGPGVAALGVVGIALPPGTTFSIAEQDPGPQVGLVDAYCQAGESTSFELTEGTSTIADISAPDGVDRIDCVFRNGSVRVCVTKRVGTTANLAGFTNTGITFTATVDGVPLPGPAMTPQAPGGETPCVGVGDDDYFLFYVAPGSVVELTEALPAGSPLGLVSAICQADDDRPQPLNTSLAGQTVVFGVSDVNVDCTLTNDTLILCVNKRVGQYTLDAGFTASQFGFTVVDGGETIEPVADIDCKGENTDQSNTIGYALKPDSGGTVTVTENSIGADSQVGLIEATCYPGLNFSTPDLATNSVTSPKQHGGDNILRCEFINVSVEVTIEKTLITDDGATASVGDFLFDVFDDDGAALESGLSTGAKFYVAPGTTFKVSERAAVGFTSTATCSDVESIGQALPAAVSVTHTPGEFTRQVVCTFVNDDIGPIPICALLIFEEGSTGFTLDDFSLELFKDGALIGQRSAGDPFDAACEDTTDNTASLLPGSLVQLGNVFADGSSFAFAVSIADPDELLVFEPLSCSVDAPAATQALAGADPVTFTVDPGTTRVNCVARANEKPLVIGSGGGLPGGRPPYVEPVVAAAAAAPAPEAAQVVAVAVAAPAPIAVTGSSTTGVTLPAAFGLLSAGFVGLGLDRRRRNRNELG